MSREAAPCWLLVLASGSHGQEAGSWEGEEMEAFIPGSLLARGWWLQLFTQASVPQVSYS